MYNNISKTDIDGLVDNPNARVAVCLCLDASYSMVGNPIDELNEGIKIFYDSIKDDEIARLSAEIAIVTFGHEVKCIQNFSDIDSQDNIPKIEANGGTPMGEAVNLALDLLEQRKEIYKSKGVDYFQPWLVLMTDGYPNGNMDELKAATEKTSLLVNMRKLTIFPIGIGDLADMNVLQKFSPNRSPLKLKGLKFREFFTWLSKSVSSTSQSMPGEKVPLDVDGLKGWAEL